LEKWRNRGLSGRGAVSGKLTHPRYDGRKIRRARLLGFES
jgi:hypothetical protein